MPPRYSPNDEPDKLDSEPTHTTITPTTTPTAQPETTPTDADDGHPTE